MSLTTEGSRKLEEMKAVARRQYHRLSVLPDAVILERFNHSRHPGEFFQLPYRLSMEIDSFNDPTYFMDLVFIEIGRGLAFSEEKIIVEELMRITQPSDPSNRFVEEILRAKTELEATGSHPSLMFAPVDRYTDWHNDLMANVHFNSVFRINTREEQTFLDFADGTRIRWAWSNKYVPSAEYTEFSWHLGVCSLPCSWPGLLFGVMFKAKRIPTMIEDGSIRLLYRSRFHKHNMTAVFPGSPYIELALRPSYPGLSQAQSDEPRRS